MISSAQRIYYINTINRDSGTTENFTYTLQIPDSERYDRVVVLSASIPTSFDLVQKGLNTFIIREMGADSTVTIPPGNYSAKSFALVVSALMTAASTQSWAYSITLPNPNVEASTGKFTYTVSGNGINQPAIICSDTVNEQLGFYINSTNTFSANKIISTTTVNFSCESQLFLHSNIADNGDSDVLQEFFGGASTALSYLVYQCSAPAMYSKALQTSQSNTFNFSLTNEKKQLMNLKGVNMQLTICVYRQDPTYEMIRNYIKFRVQNDEQK